ncbi:hypothetical protein, partial [Streptomyces sp. NPDC058678]|uniref:hypothetical protein n=1 Tax=Streptomyces sp. NPDC058678 TaxID=3346595 RepID=UPI00366115CD
MTPHPADQARRALQQARERAAGREAAGDAGRRRAPAEAGDAGDAGRRRAPAEAGDAESSEGDTAP